MVRRIVRGWDERVVKRMVRGWGERVVKRIVRGWGERVAGAGGWMVTSPPAFLVAWVIDVAALAFSALRRRSAAVAGVLSRRPGRQ